MNWCDICVGVGESDDDGDDDGEGGLGKMWLDSLLFNKILSLLLQDWLL